MNRAPHFHNPLCAVRDHGQSASGSPKIRKRSTGQYHGSSARHRAKRGPGIAPDPVQEQPTFVEKRSA